MKVIFIGALFAASASIAQYQEPPKCSKHQDCILGPKNAAALEQVPCFEGGEGQVRAMHVTEFKSLVGMDEDMGQGQGMGGQRPMHGGQQGMMGGQRPMRGGQQGMQQGQESPPPNTCRFVAAKCEMETGICEGVTKTEAEMHKQKGPQRQLPRQAMPPQRRGGGMHQGGQHYPAGGGQRIGGDGYYPAGGGQGMGGGY